MPPSRILRTGSCVLVLCIIVCLTAGQKNSPSSEPLSAESRARTVSTEPGGLSWAVGDSGTVLRGHENAEDGGDWEQVIITGIEQGEWNFHGVFCADSDYVWIVGNRNGTPQPGLGIILRTADGGRDWICIFPSLPDGETSTVELLDIEFENHQCGWIHTGDEYLLVTTDGGYTWVWSRAR
jgi:photosystem II stability/assembly factor-like uncharacterized protein